MEANVVLVMASSGCIGGCIEVVTMLVVTNRSSRPVVTNSGCIDVIGEAALGIRQLRSEIH